MLNHTEKQRQKLLAYTRNLYTDKRNVPAIHPRYKAAYYQVYPENENLPKSSLGLRMVLCMTLFAIYIVMKQNGTEILGMDNLQVLDIITKNCQIKLY